MRVYHRVLILTSLLVLAGRAMAAEPAKNVLFYGNSFLNNVGVPGIFQKVAKASGQPQPNIVNAAVNSMTLEWHAANNQGPITASGLKWDYVVLQEYSTRPTNITYGSPDLGNVPAFKAAVQTLYNAAKVSASSPDVKVVLMETWARHPTNANEYRLLYPNYYNGKTSPYIEGANQMQAELRQYYGEAQQMLGSAGVVAPVGDAFQATGFDVSLYNTDLYHESSRGGLLAALLLYQSVYGRSATEIPYSAMTSNFSMSSFGFTGPTASADWTAFTGTAASFVPEPVGLGLAGVGIASLLVRRRTVSTTFLEGEGDGD